MFGDGVGRGGDHDLEIAKGVEAAHKLVQVGERAKATEAAADHRALLAWLQA